MSLWSQYHVLRCTGCYSSGTVSKHHFTWTRNLQLPGFHAPSVQTAPNPWKVFKNDGLGKEDLAVSFLPSAKQYSTYLAMPRAKAKTREEVPADVPDPSAHGNADEHDASGAKG